MLQKIVGIVQIAMYTILEQSPFYGIITSESIGLPAPECLMVKELVNGTLENISGIVDYSDYKSLN